MHLKLAYMHLYVWADVYNYGFLKIWTCKGFKKTAGKTDTNFQKSKQYKWTHEFSSASDL